MQSPLTLILLWSGSDLTARAALIPALHTPRCSAYSPRLHKDTCIYLSLFCLSFLLFLLVYRSTKCTGKDHFFWCGILPLSWYIQTNLTEERPSSFCKGDGDFSWTHFHASAESWEITLSSKRACTEGPKSLYSSSSSAMQKFITSEVSVSVCPPFMQQKRLHPLLYRRLAHLFYFQNPKAVEFLGDEGCT